MKNLGAMFTCYDEVDAIQYSLESLLTQYPDIPVALFCESSVDLGLENFKSVKVYRVEDTLTKTFQITDKNFIEPDYQEHIYKSSLAVINRIKESINFCKSKNIIMLDPDAIVRGKLNIPENFSLLGSRVNKNKKSLEALNHVLTNYGCSNLDCWGATPAIFNVEKIQKAFSIIEEKQERFLKDLCKSFYAIYAHDLLLPIIFSIIKEQEQFNPDIIECLRDPNWESDPRPLLHQFKKLYKRK